MPKVKQLDTEVARKIAAGEVIDRPAAIVRELMDNAVDSGANLITVEITGGGIEKIRVIDNGSGMTKEDLQACARPHATSKITTEEDLLKLSTLGFRGEALSSMAAVSRLEITSGGWKMNASLLEDHIITPTASSNGTIVQTSALFENIPARRRFLKRPSSEGSLCLATFEEKVLPRPDIAFKLIMDNEEKINLPSKQSLKDRFLQTLKIFEDEKLFYEIKNKSSDNTWSFSLVIGEPAVSRSNRKNIYIYVNGRRIQEYSFVQAIEYGAQGYFPNGTHPVACLFMQVDPSLVDFNIHPAKKEAKFKDIAPLHHGISSAVKDFYKKYTISSLKEDYVSESQLNIDSYEQEESNNKNNKTIHNNFSSYQTSSIPKITSYSNVKRQAFNSSSDRYSSFKGKNAYMASEEYTNRIAQIASVPGRITHPNYLKDETNNSDFHFVGSALGNFLIAEKNDILYIIDQHAAHERYLYNQIMAEASQKQTLIVPYTIQTQSQADDNYLQELKEKLEEAGFTGKNCGDGKWEFYTVPIKWKGSEKDLENDLLDRRINPKDMINAVAASAACRTAVMDGDVLDKETAAWIAEQALLLPDPHCPHGRPVYTTITRKQLFMLVKRL